MGRQNTPDQLSNCQLSTGTDLIQYITNTTTLRRGLCSNTWSVRVFLKLNWVTLRESGSEVAHYVPRAFQVNTGEVYVLMSVCVCLVGWRCHVPCAPALRARHSGGGGGGRQGGFHPAEGLRWYRRGSDGAPLADQYRRYYRLPGPSTVRITHRTNAAQFNSH